MIQIELITTLPDWDWLEHSQHEISMTDKDEIVDGSDIIWRIGNVAVIGYIYSSFVNPPWMWFVLTKGVKVTDLLDFRRLCRLIPKGTLTTVAVDYPAGHKFARFFGFVETGEELLYINKPYRVWRKV